MATMTFLAVFDGDLTFTSSAGSGTLDQTGTVTYGAGFFAGKDGVITGGGSNYITDSAAETASKLGTTAGAIAVRFRRTTDTGGNETLVSLGQSPNAANQFLQLKIDTSDRLVVDHRKGSGSTTPTTLTSPTVATATHYFAYTDFTGTATSLYLGSDGLTGTRDASPLASYISGNMGIGVYGFGGTNNFTGLIDCVAFWDAPLTTIERQYLESLTTPWTWQMSLEPPAPTVNAGADDAVLVNTEWTRSGSFTDPFSSSFTATVDYDDGDGPVELTLTGTDFDLAYTWDSPGTKTVVVAVEGDGGIGTDTVQVTVSLSEVTGGFIISAIEGTHPTAPRISLT